MASPPSTPKRKRSILPTSFDALLHPGWRTKRARSGSRPGSPTNSGASTPGVGGSESYSTPQSSTHPDIMFPGGNTGPHHVSEHHTQDNTIPAPDIIVQSSSAVPIGPTSTRNKSEVAWTGLERALRALHITTQGCPPLHSAVDGFKSCLDVFKEAAQPRKDYDELATGLTAMVELLNKHLQVSASNEIIEAITGIASDLAEEVEWIKKRMSISGSRRVLGPSGDEEDLVRRYHRIEHIFRRLQAEASMSTWDSVKRQEVNTRLENLGPVKLATYNSKLSMDVGRHSCTENTRTQILQDLMAWAADSEGAKIYWMNGMAGTGKTTIAYSLCKRLEAAEQLAGSFFCTRTSRECSEAKQIVPTIAYQLARYSAPFRDALCGVLQKKPDVGTLNTDLQLESLLVKPLRQVGKMIGRNLVIVIDALDEFHDLHAIKVVLDMLLPFAKDSPIKFFVTSRPEPTIRDCMMLGSGEGNYPRSILYLHEIEKSLVQADIELYLKDELRHMLPAHRLSIEVLAKQASNLFIYAATAVRYIQAAGKAFNSKRLKTILDANNQSKNGLSAIGALYYTILSAAIHDNPLEPEERDIILAVLWTVVCAYELVPINTLVALCDLDETDLVVSALQPLRSVLHVSEHNQLVTTLHASFPDFIFSRDRSKDFFCDRPSHDQFLARRCMEIMKTQLRFNICRIESSFISDYQIPDPKKRVEESISRELLYACRFWVDHLVQGSSSQSLIAMVHDFLLHRLLFWMEVMNVAGYMQAGARTSVAVHTWLESANAVPDVIALARDAQRFVGKYSAHEISGSTPHIYVSALALLSPSNLIFQTYHPRFTGLVKATGTAMDKIDRGSLTVWSLHLELCSASFSADGKYVVIGYYDGKIGVYQAHDGRDIISFQGHRGRVQSVSISNDGTLMASSLDKDHTVCVWNVSDGSLAYGPLKGHLKRVTSIMFSPDGMRLVSGSDDCTIRTWVTSGASSCRLLLAGHKAPVNYVMFSPDGTQIVSVSDDRTICLWDAISGILRYMLPEHSGLVSCVCFSPCGSFIVSGSYDRTVRIWDPQNGTPIGSLVGHSGRIQCISISPDGERIASCDINKKIQVRDRSSGKLIDGPFQAHPSGIISMQFSADGARLMSASFEGNIQVWDLQGRSYHDAQKDFTPHGRDMTMCAISPGGAYIVSGAGDGTIGVWNLQSARLERVFASRSDSYEGIVLLSFSSNSTHIFAAHNDGVLEVFDTLTGELVRDPYRFSPHEEIAHLPFALSSDGRGVVSTDSNYGLSRGLDLWDLESNRLVHTIEVTDDDGWRDPFKEAVFSPDGKWFATGTTDGIIDIWDSYSGEHVTRLVHPSPKVDIQCMSISPDGTQLIYIYAGEVPRIYNLVEKTCSILSSLPSFEMWNGIAKLSPNGEYVALKRGYEWGVYASFVGVYRTHDTSGESLKKETRIPADGSFSGFSLEFITDESCLMVAAQGKDIRVRRLYVGGFSTFRNDEDIEWVLDVNDERVIWMPPEVKNWFPEASGSNLSEHSSITVNYDNILVGTNWSQCYIGDSH